jgi:hypothetical protein
MSSLPYFLTYFLSYTIHPYRRSRGKLKNLAKFGKNLFLRSWLNLGNLGKVLDNGRGIMYSGSKLKK